MSKSRKFDKACYIPYKGKYGSNVWSIGYKAELEGRRQEAKNRKKQAGKRK